MLQVYWKNATDKVVGSDHGITQTDLTGIENAMQRAHETVVQQCREGTLGYAALPSQRPQYAEGVKRLVAKYQPDARDMVVLGIGGSALGNIALQSALNPSTWNLLTDRARKGPRLFVVDNVDPALLKDIMKIVQRRLDRTVVNVISKSGETAETASQFMLFRDLLQRKVRRGWADRIVATTDAKKGTLHEIAKAEGYEMLDVPDDVGGRFSVLSPVGLFSAAMCNIDIDQLLAGAESMKQRCEVMDIMQNPGCMLAAVKYLMMAKKGKPMHVMMPYSNRLHMMADWYRQLWAESLGKKTDRDGHDVFVGPTPIKALGTTDQHSQVQLYREGPNDKLTVFLEVKKHPANTRIPEDFTDVPGLGYLAKRQTGKLISAEKLATEFALATSQRPSVTIRFPEINAKHVGEFLYLYEFTTSLMGELLNINAYDQPAVELGKQATFALMGRDGYDDLAKRTRPFKRTDKRYLA